MRSDDGEDEIADAFKVFDTDGNGYISTDELRDVMQSMEGGSQADIDAMIKEADASGDGQIDIEEFMQILNEGSGIMPPRISSPTIT